MLFFQIFSTFKFVSADYECEITCSNPTTEGNPDNNSVGKTEETTENKEDPKNENSERENLEKNKIDKPFYNPIITDWKVDEGEKDNKDSNSN